GARHDARIVRFDLGMTGETQDGCGRDDEADAECLSDRPAAAGGTSGGSSLRWSKPPKRLYPCLLEDEGGQTQCRVNHVRHPILPVPQPGWDVRVSRPRRCRAALGAGCLPTWRSRRPQPNYPPHWWRCGPCRETDRYP